MDRATFDVEVVYCGLHQQWVMRLQVPEGTTVEQVIRSSGILEQAPEVDLERQAVGVWGAVVARDQDVRQGDRVEIYRPLPQDPKDRRRSRALKRRV